MRTAWITLLLAAALSAGCSGGAEQNANGQITAAVPVPSRTAELPVAPAEEATAALPDETAPEAPAEFKGTADNTLKENPNATGAVLLRDVRSAVHPTYDRVVFEFEGVQLPSYKVEYIDKPVRSCGSGDVVPLAGDAWLSVLFTGANAHTDAGEPTIKDRTRSPNHTIVKDLKLTCDFEAEVEWVMGVASPNKYRVLELKNPTRLVVDVNHNR
jgi:hypothetical protein